MISDAHEGLRQAIAAIVRGTTWSNATMGSSEAPSLGGAVARWTRRATGFFAAFDGPARAIRCAQAIVAGVRSMGIEIRAGLHTGECDITDGKVAGITVAIGSRIASLAAPSEVLVSRTVRDLVAGSGLVFQDRGEHELKGVPGGWRLYAVVAD